MNADVLPIACNMNNHVTSIVKQLLLALAMMVGYNADCRAVHPAEYVLLVDDKESFTGVFTHQWPESYFDALKSSQCGKLKLHNQSPFPRVLAQDVLLKGNVTFRCGEFPDLPLQSLRLVYNPESRENGGYADGYYYDWRIDNTDAQRIISYYQGLEDSRLRVVQFKKTFFEWLPLLAPIIAAACSLLAILVIVRLARRGMSAEQCVAPKPRK